MQSKIRYNKNEANLKLIDTLNKGIEFSKGKYIVRMDADDISLPHRLKTQFDFMEQHPNIAICGSWFESFDGKTGVAKYVANHREIMTKMLYQCHFCHPSVIIRKGVLDDFSIKYNSDFTHAEDYDLFSRIGEKFELANIQEVLIKYRIHIGSVSHENKDIQQRNSMIVKKNLFGKIGLELTEAEINFYRSIMEQNYEQSYSYLANINLLLEKLLMANEITAFFEKKFFRNFLAQLWFNVTYNTTSLGMTSFNNYRASVLYSYKHISVSRLLKFFFKSLFKY
jgi:glycosyltransferase involved in cell wall biosynthesis